MSKRLQLSYPHDKAAILALFAAHTADEKQLRIVASKKPMDVAAEIPFFAAGESITGDLACARYIAGNYEACAGLFGENADADASFGPAKVLEWLAFAETLTDAAAVTANIQNLNTTLTMRTYLVGHQVTVADWAVLAALAANGNGEQLFKRRRGLVNVFRWMKHLTRSPVYVRAVADSEALRVLFAQLKLEDANANAASNKQAKKSKSSSGDTDIRLELPGATMGGVVTRFPPEPSGYLHIGHVRAAMLNNYFARKYEGKLLLRFDDTNPSKEKVEFVESIIEDLKTLGIYPDGGHTYTSDHFDTILEKADKMVANGDAYVDQASADEISDKRKRKEATVARENSTEKNLELWNKMKSGEITDAVLRWKIDMDHKNACMRDPAIYRVITDIPHHRTGDKFNVYPLYDFACPIVDSVEGVTHAMRSLEYKDHDELYYYAFKQHTELRPVHIWDFARINFSYTLMSKRKLQWFVDTGRVNNWDHPSFPTVRGMFRHGITKQALFDFMLAQGAGKASVLMDIGRLWAQNRKIIDKTAPRYIAVAANNKVRFTLENGPEPAQKLDRPRHKKNPELGIKQKVFSKTIWFEESDAQQVSVNEEVTLIDWGNAIVKEIVKDDSGKVLELKGVLHLEGDFKKTKLKLTWVPDVPEAVPVTLSEYGYLITKPKLEEGDTFENVINNTLRVDTAALADPTTAEVEVGTIIQFERRGFFRLDKLASDDQPAEYVKVPEGKVKDMSTISSKLGGQNASAAAKKR